MEEDCYKEVYFGEWLDSTHTKQNPFGCYNCKFYTKSEDDRPCFECLATPYNTYSHKPVNWKKVK